MSKTLIENKEKDELYEIIEKLTNVIVEKIKKKVTFIDKDEKKLEKIMKDLLEYSDMEHFEHLNEFVLFKEDSYKLKSIEYVKNRLKMLEDEGITKKDIAFARKQTVKNYGLVLVKKIALFYGYDMKRRSRIRNGKEETCYVPVKIK